MIRRQIPGNRRPAPTAGAAAPAWSPSSLTPHLWLSAADLGSLYTDAARTTPVTADSDPVGAYSDKSGNARHFTGSSTTRPVYKATGIGTHKSVRWDDTDDVLTATAFCPTGAQTLAFVFKMSAAPGAAEFDGLLDLSTGARSTIFYVCNFGGYSPLCWCVDYTGGGAGIGFSWSPDTSAHTLLVTYDGTGPNVASHYQCWLDGVSQTIATTGAFGLSSNASLGNSGAGGYPFAGDISEVIVAPGVVAGADLTSLQSYLAGLIA